MVDGANGTADRVHDAAAGEVAVVECAHPPAASGDVEVAAWRGVALRTVEADRDLSAVDGDRVVGVGGGGHGLDHVLELRVDPLVHHRSAFGEGHRVHATLGCADSFEQGFELWEHWHEGSSFGLSRSVGDACVRARSADHDHRFSVLKVRA
jgi:hypothetical protein